MTIWYPSPEAFNDLTVTDTDEGFTLSAPDGTECADWIAYYNSSEELHDEFEREFIKMLMDYVRELDTNGCKEQNAERISKDREQAEIN